MLYLESVLCHRDWDEGGVNSRLDVVHASWFMHLYYWNGDLISSSPCTFMLTLWQAERHFCHLRFTGAATILSFFRSILLAWILLAKLSVNVQ